MQVLLACEPAGHAGLSGLHWASALAEQTDVGDHWRVIRTATIVDGRTQRAAEPATSSGRLDPTASGTLGSTPCGHPATIPPPRAPRRSQSHSVHPGLTAGLGRFWYRHVPGFAIPIPYPSTKIGDRPLQRGGGRKGTVWNAASVGDQSSSFHRGPVQRFWCLSEPHSYLGEARRPLRDGLRVLTMGELHWESFSSGSGDLKCNCKVGAPRVPLPCHRNGTLSAANPSIHWLQPAPLLHTVRQLSIQQQTEVPWSYPAPRMPDAERVICRRLIAVPSETCSEYADHVLIIRRR